MGIWLVGGLSQVDGAQVQVAGNSVFLINGQGELGQFNVSTGSSAVLVSTLSNLNTVRGLHVYGRYTTLAAEQEGLLIFDVSIATNLTYVGRYNTAGSSLDVEVIGGVAFVADGENGIEVVDVTEPEWPLQLSTIYRDYSVYPESSVSGLQVSSNLLYAASGKAGLQIYNVSNPLHTAWVGAYRTSPAAARQVRVASGFAYVLCDGGRLEIVNVKDPASPVLAGSFVAGGGLADLDVQGTWVFLANTNGTLAVLDTRTAATPSVQRTYPVPGGAMGVRVVGNTAFVRTGAGELVLVPLAGFGPVAPELVSPVESVTGFVGQELVVLSVVAEGTPPLTYQWSTNGTPLMDGGRLNGTTSPHLRIVNLDLGDAGSYGVIVNNALGQVVSSNFLTVVPIGTPIVKGSCTGTFNANPLAMIQWTDQSGNDRHATQLALASQPVLQRQAVNGQPAVRFDGLDDFLTFELPVNGLTGMSMFLVAANTQDQNGGVSGAERAALFWGESQYWGGAFLSPYPSSVNLRFGTTQSEDSLFYSRPASVGSDFTLTTAIKDETTDTLYVNGVEVFRRGDMLSTIAGCQDTGNVGRGYNNNTFYAGDIAEVLVYGRALSGAEQQAVEQYLESKYKLFGSIAPTILYQPADLSVEEPAPAGFDVEALGSMPLIYQWRRNGVAIQGATGSSYVLSPTVRATDDGAQFDVVVSNNYGAVTSRVATLFVSEPAVEPPSIESGPADLTVTEPQGGAFGVVASGSMPLAYQWRRDGVPLSGATASQYVLAETSLADHGARFDVVVWNGAGSVTSRVATLTVLPAVPQSELGLWLRSDVGLVLNGSAVSQWTDQSGNNHHASQSIAPCQPAVRNLAVNGLPAIHLDGTNDFLIFNLPVNGLTGMSIFLVAANTQNQNVGASGGERAVLFWNQSQYWGSVFLSPFQSSVNLRFGTTQSGNSVFYTRPASLGSNFTRTTAIKDGAKDTLYVNGAEVLSQLGKLSTIAGCREIGNVGRGYNDNTFYAGDVAEVLVYRRALSSSERQVVEQYLENKYRLPTLPGPTITSQPADVTVGEPDPASFDVEAIGTLPLSYQWRRGGVAINGATASSYVLGSTSHATDSGARFDVVVSNGYGAVTSQVATLTVNAPAVSPTVPESVPSDGLALWLRADAGTVVDPYPGTMFGMDTAQNIFYAATGKHGLEIFDVRNPRWPVRLGEAVTTGFALGLEVLGEYIFMAMGPEGLKIFNTRTLSAPILAGVYDTMGTAYSLQVVGGTVYVADGEGGLAIISANDPSQPVRLGGFATAGTAYQVQVLDGLAYVADGPGGVVILDVTDPTKVVWVGEYDTAGDARGIQVVGNTAYVADGSGGLLLLDVADPAHPIRIGQYSANGPVLGLAVVEDMAFLAEGPNGFERVNISNPTNIVRLGTNNSIGYATGIKLAGPTAYVTTQGEGVKILTLAGLRVSQPEMVTLALEDVVLPTQSVRFEVVVNGTSPLRYQWFKDGQVLFETSTTKGVASPVLELRDLEYDDSATYSVLVRDAWNQSVSQTAKLRVVPVGTPVFRSAHFDGGDLLNVHVVGNLAYAASRTNGLQIIDLHDLLHPVRVGGHATAGFAQDVQVSGHLAYVAAWDAGLEIFDVLDPVNVVRLGGCDTPGFARGVYVSGSRAYVADYHGGLGDHHGKLWVIDVSQPTRPIPLGEAVTSGFALGVHTAGNTAFVAASEGGLEIFDTSDPFHLKRIGRLDTPGDAEGVEVVANLAYVADYDRGLQIISVTNPAAPCQLGTFPTRGDAFNVQVVDGLAYVAEGINGIEVVNVRDAAHPSLALTGIAGDSVHGLHLIGKHVFLADRLTGFIVSDLLGLLPVTPRVVELPTTLMGVAGQELVISVASEGTPPLSFQWYKEGAALSANDRISGVNDPHLRIRDLVNEDAGNYGVEVSNSQGRVMSATVVVTVAAVGTPIVKQTFDTRGEALAAAVQGNLVFVADGSAGLRIIDVSDSTNPRGLGEYSSPGATLEVWAQSNLVYLAKGDAGLEIVDVSNPFNPVRIGGYKTAGKASAVEVVGGLAYVAVGEAGLEILSITNPASPTLLGSITLAGTANDVFVVGSLAYVADGEVGLQIIDVRNPADPVWLGRCDTPGTAFAVCVSGNLAFVADGPQGLAIIDVENSAQPTMLSRYATAGLTMDLALVGPLVVVADGTGGFVVLDASRPEQVVPVGGDGTGDKVRGIALDGSMAYFASGTAGLQIVELTGLSATAPAILAQPASQTSAAGGLVEFHTILSGSAPLNCRWYFGDRALVDDAYVSGAASPDLRISNVQREHQGSYQLRAWNSAGLAQSQPAFLNFVGPVQARINAAAPGEVITLQPGVYGETLLLDRNLTLAGAEWETAILDGLGLGTVVHVAPQAQVSLRGLTIRRGSTRGGLGGVILNEGHLTLQDCIVTGGYGEAGGGIANLRLAKIIFCVISNNAGAGRGGGIFNSSNATLEIRNSTIAWNRASQGAGIDNAGNLFAINSTLCSNVAAGVFGTSDGNGGGLRSAGGSATLENCTVSGNEAWAHPLSPGGGSGGGIEIKSGLLELQATTLCFNTAARTGGGVWADPNSGVRVQNTILARNSASGAGSDFHGVLFSAGYNLLQSISDSVIVGDTAGNILGRDPLLGPIGEHGSPAWTHLLQPDSPAIDAGGPDSPAIDQRGIERPFDIPWFNNAADGRDIGAVEYANVRPYLTRSDRTALGFTLSWVGSGILQRAPTATGPWEEMTDTSPFFVAVQAGPPQFYQLRAALTPPNLTMSGRTPTGFDLSWSGVGILQRAPSLRGPWHNVGSRSPIHVTVHPGNSEFYRLRIIDQ
jgi:hypothetical protein